MSPKKADQRPTVQIEMADGFVRALTPVWRYRFLFANGDVLDVDATQDNSDLRAAVLDYRKIDDDRIVGVADAEQTGWVRAEGGPEPGAML